jgi:ATP-dependent DNA helicase RecG
MGSEFRQLTIDFDAAERRSVLELWHVDEIYRDATGELLEELYEDTRIERKPGGFHAESLAIYISMWANTGPDGGLIALGVEDDGTIVGCQEKGQEIVANEARARRDLVPDARFESKRIQVRTVKGEIDFVHLIYVQFRSDKVVETNKGEAWIRNGNTKRLIGEEEKQELKIERGQLSFELEACGLSWPNDFDTHAIATWASVVSHSDGILSSTARARRTFSRIVSALAVQTKPFALSL